MKKTYNNPRILIVDLGDSGLCDIVTSSLNDNEVGMEGGHTADARQRRTSIWDDEF